MSVFSERPGDMRHKAGDAFDFGASARRAAEAQARPPAKPATSTRGRKVATMPPGHFGLAIGAMATYWFLPAMIAGRRRKQPPPPPADPGAP